MQKHYADKITRLKRKINNNNNKDHPYMVYLNRILQSKCSCRLTWEDRIKRFC